LLSSSENIASLAASIARGEATARAVAESAVIASPDEMRGEVVKAFVILAPGYTASSELASELQEHVKRVTAPYKYPREIEFVESLPKTISGKIRRVELRDMERQKRLGK